MPDLRIVLTTDLAEARGVVGHICESNSLGLVTGASGLGKNFAIDRALEELAIDRSIRLSYSRSPTPLAIAASMHHQLTGEEAHGGGNALLDRVAAELLQRPMLVEVNEISRFARTALGCLRYVWDATAEGFPLLLIGDERTAARPLWQAGLMGRVSRSREFRPLARADVQREIPSLHPIYARASSRDIATIDQAYARGVLGRWATFTWAALHQIGPGGVLTTALMQRTLRFLPRP